MSKTRTVKMVFCAMVLLANCMGMAADDAPVTPAVSDGPSLGFNVSTAFMSKYIWRGQLLNDDYVMQPSVGASYGGLSASLWGNVDMTNYHRQRDGGGVSYGHSNEWEFTEYDWTIGYADKIPGSDILKYSVGVIYYYFPSGTDEGILAHDTTEVYAGLGLDTFLSPTVTLYRDIDEFDGTYAAFSVSHAIEKIFELSPDMPVGMTASASVGWGSASYNKGYWDSTQTFEKGSSLQDLTVSVGFPVVVMGWTVTPSVNYVTLLDSDIRKTDAYSNGSIAGHSTNKTCSDYFFTGLTLSRSF
ncbi:MAG: hypothetical protein FJ263_06805 [Planctomycetes bacterium]|nr:hypothetical protein [Planctomycetota bacterium]